MAGMLPGVESARRRRFHHSSGDSPGGAAAFGLTRRSSFCLYTSNHETSHPFISFLQRSISNQAYEEEKLGGLAGAARQAKERLDERLRTQRKSASKRHETVGSLRGAEGRSMAVRELQTEVFGSKKNNGSNKKFNWAKLSWKATEQEECTICLERFKSGETLAHLPCAHRFHWRCLVPWLENNAHCPCCRMEIHVEFS
ncbi:hypothetical protein P3X46_031660 [Hevea brasiliensis]|uniref:RING-type domain-containing protein n=1 Tax=Hevea brasiliensis TaxID=3981 RepID=A0ABQ9KL13_HEVBR|nr:probable E3 ubiquitin-protein ligase RHY1A [Hevea brasiliensis]XP_021672280.2 probable E3 ubiquitin-protein ligase RHY1A [Hevea brasiliensis]KAJ9141083.1 hypothetical protein P3X46_031660 [Hevea brasiliensis]